MMGIEPITYHLQGDCSTVELHRQTLHFKVQIALRLHDYTKAYFQTQGFLIIQYSFELRLKSLSDLRLKVKIRGL